MDQPPSAVRGQPAVQSFSEVNVQKKHYSLYIQYLLRQKEKLNSISSHICILVGAT
jgi:hypothetical protein